jgi:hypothetical protein
VTGPDAYANRAWTRHETPSAGPLDALEIQLHAQRDAKSLLHAQRDAKSLLHAQRDAASLLHA